MPNPLRPGLGNNASVRQVPNNPALTTRTTNPGNSGSNVQFEPFQHLIQHIKQSDPMLYEALRRASRYFSENVQTLADDVDNFKTTGLQDKATFGLMASLIVASPLPSTNYYICRASGTFTDFATKVTNQAPTGANAILDVLLSADDGLTWHTIFGATKIVLPAGATATVITNDFAIPGIDVGNLLRIDCLQIGSGNPGKGIEVVGRWSVSGFT